MESKFGWRGLETFCQIEMLRKALAPKVRIVH
jgi:hypothetical protein